MSLRAADADADADAARPLIPDLNRLEWISASHDREDTNSVAAKRTSDLTSSADADGPRQGDTKVKRLRVRIALRPRKNPVVSPERKGPTQLPAPGPRAPAQEKSAGPPLRPDPGFGFLTPTAARAPPLRQRLGTPSFPFLAAGAGETADNVELPLPCLMLKPRTRRPFLFCTLPEKHASARVPSELAGAAAAGDTDGTPQQSLPGSGCRVALKEPLVMRTPEPP